MARKTAAQTGDQAEGTRLRALEAIGLLLVTMTKKVDTLRPYSELSGCYRLAINCPSNGSATYRIKKKQEMILRLKKDKEMRGRNRRQKQNKTKQKKNIQPQRKVTVTGSSRKDGIKKMLLIMENVDKTKATKFNTSWIESGI